MSCTIGSTGYKKSTNSFIFSLRNKDNLKPFQSPVYRNSGNAIYQNPGYGPTFGGGHDLYVKDNAFTTTGSYSNFGHTYKPPTDFTESQKLKLFWLEIITLYQQKSKYFICVNLRQYGITIVFEKKQEHVEKYSVYENFVRSF